MTGVWQQNGCGLAAVSLSTFLGTVGLTWVGPAAESWCHGGRLPGGVLRGLALSPFITHSGHCLNDAGLCRRTAGEHGMPPRACCDDGTRDANSPVTSPAATQSVLVSPGPLDQRG